MPSSTTGATLSGAASGAAAGTAVMPGIGTAVGAIIGGVGGYLSASGTASAQDKANKAAAQQAAAQSAQSFFNYLSSRGVNLQQLAGNNPAFAQEFARVQAAGDKRDFQTWIYDHLKNHPEDGLWDQIANPAAAGGASNTTLPAWAVDASGNPIQPALYNDLLNRYNFGGNTATASAYQSLQQNPAAGAAQLWLKANPTAQTAWDTNANGVQEYYGGDFNAYVTDNIQNLGTPAQKAALAGTISPQDFATAFAGPAAGGAAGGVAGAGTVAQPGAPGGVVNTSQLDPNIASLIFGGGTSASAGAGGALGSAVGAPPGNTYAGPRVQTDAELQAAWAQLGPSLSAQGMTYDQFVADQRRLEAGGAGGITAGPGLTNGGNNSPATPGRIGAATGPGGVSSNTVANIFNGQLLADQLGGIDAVAAARRAAAELQLTRNDELRAGSTNVNATELAGLTELLNARGAAAGGIYDAALTGAGGVRDASNLASQGVYDRNVQELAQVLGVRLDAAQAIYDATMGKATGVRDARTAGAEGIYGAELLQADSYGEAAKQALTRMLAEQAATRARRGLGGSSGSDLTRARLTAGALQQGAGARAQAGTNYQRLLSDAGINFAGDTGTAGVGRATTLGAANEQDAIARMNAGVTLAQQLGLAGTTYAGTVAGAGNARAGSLGQAGEQDAIGRLQSNTQNALRMAGILDADGNIAIANADTQTAIDRLNAIVANQNRQVGSVGLPYQLAGSDLALKGQLTAQQYADLDAFLARLNGNFSVGGAAGPGLTTANTGSVLNGNQIAGGVLSGLGSGISTASSNSDISNIISLLAGSNRSGVGSSTTYDDFLRNNPTSSAASGVSPIFSSGRTGGG